MKRRSRKNLTMRTRLDFVEATNPREPTWRWCRMSLTKPMTVTNMIDLGGKE
jgi:hypothetical protein